MVAIPDPYSLLQFTENMRQGNETWPNTVDMSRPLVLSATDFISDIFWHAVLDQ